MTTTNCTAATAPRNQEELQKLGRFILRNLGEEIPVWKNNDEKQAFLKLTTEEQAAEVLKGLQGMGKPAKPAGAAGGAKREPVTNGSKKPAGAASGAAQTRAADTSQGGAPSENLAALLELLGEVKTNQEALLEKYEELSSAVDLVQQSVAGTNKLTMVAVSLALQVSENVLSAPMASVLEAAIGQLPDIEPMLRDACGIPEEEEGGGEGNE